MSKTMNIRQSSSRARLLTTVSAIALAASIYGAEPAMAADPAEPMLWLEAGWHSESVHDSSDNYALPFSSLVPQSGITGPLFAALNLSRSPGDEGKITFRPDGSGWVFSASIRYGRSQGKDSINQRGQVLPTTSFLEYHTSVPAVLRHSDTFKPVIAKSNYVEADTVSAEDHFIIDFEAGKDVGIGLFGHGSTSTIGVGVRYAQLNTALNVSEFHAHPDVGFSYFQATRTAFYMGHSYPEYIHGYAEHWHHLAGAPYGAHDFIGLGPEISWDSSIPFSGDVKRGGEFLLDWGVNAAILFGKQKNKTQHETKGSYDCYGNFHFCHGTHFGYAAPTQYVHEAWYTNDGQSRTTKTVTVPNLGGFLGISYRIQDFKASFGYRADYFFRAIDTGIAGQHAVTRSFNGPYASVSIGIGD